MGHGRHVIGGQVGRFLVVGGTVPEAVGKNLRQFEPGRAVFVVIPLMKLRERQTRLGLHGHEETTGAGHCVFICCFFYFVSGLTEREDGVQLARLE